MLEFNGDDKREENLCSMDVNLCYMQLQRKQKPCNWNMKDSYKCMQKGCKMLQVKNAERANELPLNRLKESKTKSSSLGNESTKKEQ